MTVSRKLIFPTRYPPLLITTLLLLLSIAVSAQFDLPGLITAIQMTLVALSGVYVASSRRKEIYTSIAIGIPWIVLLWLHAQTDWRWTLIASSAVGAVFLGHTIYLMLHHIFRAREVGADLLAGAAAVYLLLSLIWAFLYGIVDQRIAGAFTGGEKTLFDFVYFSLTTLTTLGYGDISPVAPLPRMLAVLEAAVGVLYTAILIGRLMGIHLENRQKDNP